MRKKWGKEIRVQRIANEFRYALRHLLEDLPPEQYPPVITGCEAYVQRVQRERPERKNPIRAERAGKLFLAYPAREGVRYGS